VQYYYLNHFGGFFWLYFFMNRSFFISVYIFILLPNEFFCFVENFSVSLYCPATLSLWFYTHATV
jgi:hypothetical protein